MTPTSERLALAVPRGATGLLARRLRLAIRDGYDEDGVLEDLLVQVGGDGGGRRPPVRGACRLCGHVLADIPPVARCPACGGRYLVFTREEARHEPERR
jgi:rubrerythrin